MKYYVVSDCHSFYSELIKALTDKGFFTDTEPHKLIVCGDMMDRGLESLEMQRFMMELLSRDELIFIRGNHEDLMLDMLNEFEDELWNIVSGHSHHNHNGTFDSALQLSQMSDLDTFRNTREFIHKVKNSDFCKKLIPVSRDYYETENYIFVHGWIPCETEKMPPYYRLGRTYRYNPDWRNASKKEWDAARWFNGMELAMLWDVVEKEKEIVCGHWHSSYGHSKFGKTNCSEFGEDAIFTPFYGRDIIAIDGCVAHSGVVNCLVLED